jgi:hypothetical protein
MRASRRFVSTFLLNLFFVTQPEALHPMDNNIQLCKKITFIIKNDLEKAINLHLGRGTMTINEGSAYKFTKEEGEKIYLSEQGQKGKLLLTITAIHEGKTFRLSELISQD